MHNSLPLPMDNHLLIIGGSGRNVGKTTLALAIIQKVAPLIPVIGLKVSTFKTGDEKFHGNHTNIPVDNYRINIETGVNPLKDTAKMIDAGAHQAFFIETTDNNVNSAYADFSSSFNSHGYPVVCESQSLRRYVKPGLFILLIDSHNTKKLTEDYVNLADYVCYAANYPVSLEKLAKSIIHTPNGWTLNNKLLQSQDEAV